ncbi:PR domain zinc finger protein 14 [Thelohanellus kitauei]|uniref:PR domain zinc finger protein 14 n=1 Tax=Thelohanellus kitauei TaxID=669202 RepID=A0A0C2MWV0_THEKT|nr:PR domain zinc finger protein 14 [Thelohanellus kitauei]
MESCRNSGIAYHPTPQNDQPVSDSNECSIYGSKCSCLSYLSPHMTFKPCVVVHPSRMFKCKVCERRFENLEGLRAHIKQVNFGIMLYSCELCNDAFSQSSSIPRRS